MLKVIAFLALVSTNTPVDTSQVSRQEINCVATAIYHEARGEPVAGQVAVAQVIKNRMYSVRYPKTACGVVYDKAQFSDIETASPDYEGQQWQAAVEIASLSYLNLVQSPINGATHYYNPHKVSAYWDEGQRFVMIGNHKFMKA